ncbi:MAG: DUF542 domain-containing protein [Candidatus Margulisiibacteriota bacterium]
MKSNVETALEGIGLQGEQTIGAIVAKDYRTVAVFSKHGIDFCCGGEVSLASACKEKALDITSVIKEINESKGKPLDRSQNYASWDLSFMADYLINTHHVYLKDNLEMIVSYVDKIADVHGEHHPELLKISKVFNTIATEIKTHLLEEEEVCFPAIKRIEKALKSGETPSQSDVQILAKSLETLHKDHEAIGDATHQIRHLANEFAIPDSVAIRL